MAPRPRRHFSTPDRTRFSLYRLARQHNFDLAREPTDPDLWRLDAVPTRGRGGYVMVTSLSRLTSETAAQCPGGGFCVLMIWIYDDESPIHQGGGQRNCRR